MIQLNKAQQEVVHDLDHNIVLLASAGTGKTNTLAYRVAHIVKEGRAKGEEILCMTFTNKACKEMKERIVSLGGASAKAVEVSTFHSFCYKVLQEESKLQETLYQDMLIYDEEDCRDLLEEWRPEDVRMMDFQNLVSLVKEHRSLYNIYSNDSAMDYKETIQRLYKEESSVMHRFFKNASQETELAFRRNGHQIVRAYEESLLKVHAVDFTDLITMVHELFKDETVRHRWNKRYRYISVDEMQDTSRLEYEVLEHLWRDNVSLLCGDYFQTIYEWRGSDPLPLIEAYQRDFKARSIVFYENYRSNQALFTAAFQTLRHMFPSLVNSFYEEEPYAVAKEEGTPVVVHEAPTEWKEAAYIFDEIRKLKVAHPDETIGILVRNNRKALVLSNLFARFNQQLQEVNQIHFMVIDEYKFFRRKEIKDVMAYFKLLLNPYDSTSAKRIIKTYVKGIGDASIEAIESEEARRAGLKLTDFLSLHIFEEEPYDALEQGLNDKNVVVFDVESTGTDTEHDEIIQIAAIRIDEGGRETALFERFIKPSKSVGTSEAVHGFSDEWLAAHGEDAKTVLQDFLAFAKDSVIVGHNVNYDLAILGAELNRHGLGVLEKSGVYDTLDIFRRFYPNLGNHKLGFLATQFPIDHEPTHNALDDIRATAQLLVYAVEENIKKTKEMRKAYISRYKHAFAHIGTQLDTLRRKSKDEKPTGILAYIMNQIGVRQYYESRKEMDRVQYIRDLYTLLADLEKQDENRKGNEYLRHILELAALTAGDPDPRLNQSSRIPIVTIHQAKGSEFDHVFMAGMSEGEFPSNLAIREGNKDEEKRLFYVALTRAKKDLQITYPVANGRGKQGKGSSFLDYMPQEYIVRK